MPNAPQNSRLTERKTRMRRKQRVLVYGLLLAATAAAAFATWADEPVAERRLRVVTTMFTLYDWTRAIGGDYVDARMLMPPGTEAHTYAPRPSDVATIRQADLFVFLHPAMEPWAKDVLAGAIRPGLRILELAQNIELLQSDESDGHDHDHAHEVDPHVWLDPLRAVEMVRELGKVLGELAPEHQAELATNTEAYCARLHALDARIRESLASCRRRTVIFAGHNAFRYFAERYGLLFVSPYPRFSPDAAPSPAALTALVRATRETGSPVIFHEELISPRVAETVARETGAQLEMLHAVHNLSADDLRNGATYMSLMEENLQKLRKALDCP
jgi:zinc transport system substrate-binding protein